MVGSRKIKGEKTRRWPVLPNGRQIWFQLHWLIGLVAGSVLMLIGLSGAVLSFREELIDAINPGGRAVAVQNLPTRSPPQLLADLRQQYGQRQVGTLAVFATPGAVVRVIFAPGQGERRGDTVYLDRILVKRCRQSSAQTSSNG